MHFSLEPENEVQTALFALAVSDAAQRVRISVEHAGAHLGAVRLIDLSGRACETDVLVAGAARGGDINPSLRFAPPPMGVPAPMGAQAGVAAGVNPSRQPNVSLPLQVPLMELTDHVCIVYAIAAG